MHEHDRAESVIFVRIGVPQTTASCQLAISQHGRMPTCVTVSTVSLDRTLSRVQLNVCKFRHRYILVQPHWTSRACTKDLQTHTNALCVCHRSVLDCAHVC